MANRNGNLTLARSTGDAIKITTAFGEEIEILFHGFSGAQCKVSINAPREVHIVRAELLDETQNEEIFVTADV